MRLRPTTARPSVWAVSTEQGSREGGCRRDAGSLGLRALAGLRVLAAADNKTLQSKRKQNWFSDTQRKARSRQGGKTGRTRAVPEVSGACPAPPCFLEGSAGHRVRGTHCGPEKPSTPFSCRLSCAGLMAVVSVTPGQAVTPEVQAGDGQGACRLCRTGGRGPHSLPHAMCTYGVYVCAWPGRARGTGGAPCSPFFQWEGPQHLSPSPFPSGPRHMAQTEAGAVGGGHRRVPDGDARS